jgi:hypothetical protein
MSCFLCNKELDAVKLRIYTNDGLSWSDDRVFICRKCSPVVLDEIVANINVWEYSPPDINISNLNQWYSSVTGYLNPESNLREFFLWRFHRSYICKLDDILLNAWARLTS